jgi:hypothetical protein
MTELEKYCNAKFGETNCKTAEGKPIYFDENFQPIDTTQIELAFNFSNN